MAPGLDELDYRIINELRRDGRVANTEIARRLDVSDATVRNRIQRLTAKHVIQIAAFVNLPRLGYSVDVVVGVQCDTSRVLDVAGEIAEMPGVWYVLYVTGRYDLLVGAFFRSPEELTTFLTERLGKVPGVQKAETATVLKVVKRAYDSWDNPLGPIDDQAKPRRDDRPVPVERR